MALWVFASSGCATTSNSQVRRDVLKPQVIVEEIEKADIKIEESESNELVESKMRNSGNKPPVRDKIPVEINQNVRTWIEFFTGRGRERFQRYLTRGVRYRSLVIETLKKYKVPEELYYLAMIESGYSAQARSRQRAVGIWQFIRPTARHFGLRMTRYIDERCDPVKATEAAAAYLKYLHDKFGSWHLAMAAYNAGEGRIQGSIRRGKTRDFWLLARSGALPKETMHYVPKFFAAVMIGNDPKKYGLKDVEQASFPVVKKTFVPGAMHLHDIARLSTISYAELKFLNPHLLRGVTPSGVKKFAIWTPKADIAKFDYAKLFRFRSMQAKKTWKASGARRLARALATKPAPPFHKVTNGENLMLIAERYGTTVSRLRKLNKLVSRHFIRAGQSIRISSENI